MDISSQLIRGGSASPLKLAPIQRLHLLGCGRVKRTNHLLKGDEHEIQRISSDQY